MSLRWANSAAICSSYYAAQLGCMQRLCGCSAAGCQRWTDDGLARGSNDNDPMDLVYQEHTERIGVCVKYKGILLQYQLHFRLIIPFCLPSSLKLVFYHPPYKCKIISTTVKLILDCDWNVSYVCTIRSLIIMKPEKIYPHSDQKHRLGIV